MAFITRRGVLLLVVGQLLALCVSGTGVFTSYLVQNSINIPVFQCFVVYATLACFYGPILFFRLHKMALPLTFNPWRYLVLAICDVEANYFVVKAYQYTDLPSIQLLDCLTIPCVMILGRIVFARPWVVSRLCSAGLCVAGIVVLVLTDISRNDSSSSSASNPLLGDVFCVLSALLYALSNIGCEALLKVGQPHDEEGETKVSDALARNHNVELSPLVLSQEYIAMLSMWAVGISGVQCLVLEFDTLHATTFTAATVAYLVGFICVMFIIYTCVPLFIAYSSSTYFNLSLLCSDGYSLVFSVFLLGFVITESFLIAYVLIIVGLATYHTPPSFYSGLYLYLGDLNHTEAPTDGEDSARDGGTFVENRNEMGR